MSRTKYLIDKSRKDNYVSLNPQGNGQYLVTIWQVSQKELEEHIFYRLNEVSK